MKSIFDRKASEVSTPIKHGFNVKEQPKIKLIYNGNTFDYIPRPVMCQEDKKDWSTVTLIYRANIFERQLPPPKPYQKPRAINWRWRFEQP